MSKESIFRRSKSRSAYAALDDWMWRLMRTLTQELLKEDVIDFAGRERSVRRFAANTRIG